MKKISKIIVILLCIFIIFIIYYFVQYIKWEKYHKDMTDTVLYTDKTDEFRFKCYVNEPNKSVILRVYYKVKYHYDDEGFYDYENPDTHEKEFEVDISNLLSDDTYIELSSYGTFDETQIIVSQEERFKNFKKFDDSCKLYNNKYLLYPCDASHISMCDINTGDIYYGLKNDERFDLCTTMHDQNIRPVPILLSDDKIVVIYKYSNKIYIRRIN